VSQIASGETHLEETRNPTNQASRPKDSSTTRHELAALYAPVSAHLTAVESILQTELSSDTPFVNQLLEHSWLLGGKRMRPVLLLLSGMALAKPGVQANRELHLMGAAIEMIHTATLVHDDVLDKADLRRHQATANAKWDNRVSVLLGDYLFTHSFHVASKSGSAAAMGKLAASSNLVCAGEMKQNFHAGNFEIDESVYFEIISEKTAELCAAACGIGALVVGGSDAEIEEFESYGRDLGIAFQIIDDVLDLVGTPENVGKTLGTDLFNAKATLPIIHCLKSLGADQRLQFLTVLNEGNDVNRAVELLDSTSSIQYARQVAQQHAARAEAFAKSLPENEASKSLVKLAQFILRRTH
jgi:octaprenyl-diphosphate synthase